MGRHLGCLQYVALIADALRNILYISIFFFAHINKINNNFLGVELLCQRLYVFSSAKYCKIAPQRSFSSTSYWRCRRVTFSLHDGQFNTWPIFSFVNKTVKKKKFVFFTCSCLIEWDWAFLFQYFKVTCNEFFVNSPVIFPNFSIELLVFF